ncbi:MAG: RNase adapter RapZ [Gammaproteobacteria bacterium]
MRLLIISGLSGSGKSVALHMLEDLDYYTLDNIPARLLPTLIVQLRNIDDAKFDRIAIGLDTRPAPHDVEETSRLVGQLRQQGDGCEVLFLQAGTEVLLKRYSETRRKHPLSSEGRGLKEAIAFERQLLAPICDLADVVIDTSRMSVHELRVAVRERLATSDDGRMSMLFQSFGYKHGIPGDADFVFDARSLPNPYWVSGLRSQTGRDKPVIDYLQRHPPVKRFVDDIATFLDHWIPEIQRSNRSYLTVAIGCTGGQHRSVYVTETLAERFRGHGQRVLVRHSELPD